MEPTNDWKVDSVRFGSLRDADLQVYQEGQNFSVVHTPTGITIQSDSRDNARDNWEIAQEALQQAVEYHLTSWSNPNPGPKPTL